MDNPQDKNPPEGATVREWLEIFRADTRDAGITQRELLIEGEDLKKQRIRSGSPNSANSRGEPWFAELRGASPALDHCVRVAPWVTSVLRLSWNEKELINIQLSTISITDKKFYGLPI